MLIATLAERGIPYVMLEGAVEERVATAVSKLGTGLRRYDVV